MTWTRSEVEACLGEPEDSDIVAGWTRYWYKQERCSEWIMYKADGKVHAGTRIWGRTGMPSRCEQLHLAHYRQAYEGHPDDRRW